MSFITKFLKFIYDDFKSDIKFIINFFKFTKEDKQLVDQNKINKLKEEYDSYGGFSNYLIDVIKSYWLMLFMFALFFVAGFWLSEQYNASECNDFIQKEYISAIDRGELVYVPIGERKINNGVTNLKNISDYGWGG